MYVSMYVCMYVCICVYIYNVYIYTYYEYMIICSIFQFVDVLMQLYVYCIHVHEVLVYQASR